VADTTYQPKIYRKIGGDEMIVASGGHVTVESGGTINVATGGSLENNGTPMDLSAGIATSTAAVTAELDTLHDVTAGTITASKAVVVGSSKQVNEWTVTAGDLNVSKTITSATPATNRLVRSELTLTPTTSLAVASTGSLAGVRGCVTLTTGKEITDGFLYGVQGKTVLDGGTVSVGSGHVAGVLAQLSASGATVTDGHVAILVVSGQTLPASANVNAIYIESGGANINSAIEFNCRADYLFNINNFESCGIVAAAGTGAGAAGLETAVATRVLKVYVDGAVAYIPLYVSNA
jgi:hypothetical protein